MAIRQSQSAQSAVWVVIVEPSLVAFLPTAIAVHLSEMIAFGSDEAEAELTAQARDKQRRSFVAMLR